MESAFEYLTEQVAVGGPGEWARRAGRGVEVVPLGNWIPIRETYIHLANIYLTLAKRPVLLVGTNRERMSGRWASCLCWETVRWPREIGQFNALVASESEADRMVGLT